MRLKTADRQYASGQSMLRMELVPVAALWAGGLARLRVLRISTALKRNHAGRD